MPKETVNKINNFLLTHFNIIYKFEEVITYKVLLEHFLHIEDLHCSGY